MWRVVGRIIENIRMEDGGTDDRVYLCGGW